MARKVLLADDSIAVQRAVEATLEPKDFEVLSVSKGSEVIAEAKKTHPDLILVDGDLSDLDGYEICRRLKEDPELLSIPVIIMSSQDQPERALAAGAEAQLVKPFQGEQLLEQVLSVVDLSVESTFKLDSSEMELLDVDEGGLEEELELGELDLDEGVLELTEEMESSEETSFDIGHTSEVTLEGLDDLDLEDLPEPAEGLRSIKTEELEEISFEEEIDELDLGELDLEGEEGVGALEEELDVELPGQELGATEEVELGVELEEELPLKAGDELLGTEEEPEGLILDTQESSRPEASQEKLIDTDELEAFSLEEERLVSTGEEAHVSEDLGETSIEFEETEDLGAWEEAEEEFLVKEEISLGEELSPMVEREPLEETSLEWEEPLEGELEAPEEAVPMEEMRLEREEIPTQLTAAVVEEPRVEVPSPGLGQEREPVAATTLEPLEEVGLEDELAALTEAQEEVSRQPLELPELPIAQIPSLAQGLRLELMEEDFGMVDPFSEEGIRRELARNLQEMVERILSQMAPPIVEKVARAVALEQAERIVLEEIERIRQNPERL